MGPFTKHELDIIETALVYYIGKLNMDVFGQKERQRIEIILQKLEKLGQDAE